MLVFIYCGRFDDHLNYQVVTKKRGWKKQHTLYPPLFSFFCLLTDWLCVCLVGFPFVLSFYICVESLAALWARGWPLGVTCHCEWGDCCCTWAVVPAARQGTSLVLCCQDEKWPRPSRAFAKDVQWPKGIGDEHLPPQVWSWGDAIVPREKTAWRRRTSFKRFRPSPYSLPFFSCAGLNPPTSQREGEK